jgi:acetyl-CoA acetyltransferase
MAGATIIAGIGQTPFYRRGTSPDSERKQILRAITEACTDAGISPRDIDGFATYSDDRQNATYLMHELGTRELRWSSMVEGGGGGGIPAAVGVAAAAILTGQADVVVVTRSVSEREMGRFNTAIESQHATSHYTAHGICVAAQMMALRTQRMLHSLGVTREVMEPLVLADYYHARRNPRATAYGNSVDAAIYRSSR